MGAATAEKRPVLRNAGRLPLCTPDGSVGGRPPGGQRGRAPAAPGGCLSHRSVCALVRRCLLSGRRVPCRWESEWVVLRGDVSGGGGETPGAAAAPPAPPAGPLSPHRRARCADFVPQPQTGEGPAQVPVFVPGVLERTPLSLSTARTALGNMVQCEGSRTRERNNGRHRADPSQQCWVGWWGGRTGPEAPLLRSGMFCVVNWWSDG